MKNLTTQPHRHAIRFLAALGMTTQEALGMTSQWKPLSLLLKQMSALRAERDAGDPLSEPSRIYSDIVKQHSALRFDVQP